MSLINYQTYRYKITKHHESNSASTHWVPATQDICLISGPVYEWYFGTQPQADESHTIPSGYFNIVITDNDGQVEASAYVMEQNLGRSANYCLREVTINEVESRSGLNFMPTLQASKEQTVEGQIGGLKRKLGC